MPFTSVSRFNYWWTLVFPSPTLHFACLLAPPSLVPPPVCFLFVSEFCQELLAHLCRPSVFSLKKGILEKQPAFLNLSSLWGCIPSDFSKRICEQATACSSEIQGWDLPSCFALSSQEPELYHLVGTVVKTIPRIHMVMIVMERNWFCILQTANPNWA